MKRIVVFLCFVIVFLFAGCGTNLQSEVKINLAECRQNIFVANNEMANINFTSGIREEPYVLNGKCEQQVEFGVLTIKFLFNTKDFKNAPTYVLSINGNDYDGTLIQNPFDLTFVADINTIVLDNSTVDLKINYETISFETTLKCISSLWQTQFEDAIAIGVGELKKMIKPLQNANGINAEFYLKIITDPNFQTGPYYWYFCVLGKNGENYALVIDTNTREILAKNIN